MYDVSFPTRDLYLIVYRLYPINKNKKQKSWLRPYSIDDEEF